MRFRSAIARCSAILLVACGGSDGGSTPNPPPPPPPPPPPAPVATVTLNRDTASVIPTGTFQLTATLRDANGNALSGRTITWQSGTTTIATVDGNGLVTGVAVGASQVTASSEGQSKSANISVKDGAVVGAAGATINGAGGNASVVIPAGALAAQTTLTIAPNATPPGSNARLLTATAYDFGPDGVTFAQPATIRLKYDDAAATGHDQALLRVHKWSGTAWLPLAGSTVDVGTRTVSGNTGSFSQYSVLELVPVFGVAVTPGNTTLFTGGTQQLTVNITDSQGAAALGYSPTYSSSNEAVATVSATGFVTAVAFGTATITASAGGKNGTAAVTVITPSNIPTFTSKPFAGEFPTVNFMDHDIPKEFVDVNGVFTTFWGEVHQVEGNFIDGHSGIDFKMPEGTPLLALAPGKVVRVTESNDPFFCPPLNREVTDAKAIFIEHELPGGTKIQVWYAHQSVNQVTVGQTVAAGDQIALSGNTGCSGGPHLHIEFFRVMPNNSIRTMDSYGWLTGTDPWSAHQDGTASIQLWKPGVAPQLWREQINNFQAGNACCAAVISKIVFEGINDAANPNNEYVEIAIDLRAGSSVTLNGSRLKTDLGGLDYAFPTGVVLNAQRPAIRVYTGSGTNTSTNFYAGRPAGIHSNNGNDCVRLVGPGGGQYRINRGNGCPLPSAIPEALLRESPVITPTPFFEVLRRPAFLQAR